MNCNIVFGIFGLIAYGGYKIYCNKNYSKNITLNEDLNENNLVQNEQPANIIKNNKLDYTSIDLSKGIFQLIAYGSNNSIDDVIQKILKEKEKDVRH